MSIRSLGTIRKTLGAFLAPTDVHRAVISFVVAYVLLIGVFGLCFASVYAVYGPSSFKVDETPSLFDFMYFSCVTATTLGYGDISPSHWIAKCLVMVEVVASVVAIGLYLGAVISSLASRHTPTAA